MPRLTNANGVTVNVDDETAATLGGGWTAQTSTARKSTAKNDPKTAAVRHTVTDTDTSTTK